MHVRSFLWRYLSKAKFWIVGAFLCIGFGEGARQTGFYFASRIAGVLSDTGSKDELFKSAIFYALMFGIFIQLRTVIHNIHYWFDATYYPKIQAKILKDLFTQAHQQSVQFFTEEMAGRVAGKINQTVHAVFHLKQQFFSPLLSFFRLAIGCYFLSQIHITLGISLIFFSIFYVFLLYITSNKLVKASKDVHDKESEINGILVDTLFNYNIIKNDGNIHFEKRNFFSHIKNWIYLERNVYHIDFYVHTTQGIICALIRMVFLLIPLYYWLYDKITVADFVLAETLITYLTMFGMNITGPVSRFCRALGGIQDGLNFIYRPLQVTDTPNATKLLIKKPVIQFKNISFKYQPTDKKTLFKNFNLMIPEKVKIGLVGSSGSGKSSLIKLLLRYYDIQKGNILIDNQDISLVTQNSLRKNISIVDQNPALFNRSILENIRYGNPHATDEDVIQAAKKAYIHDMIMRLPKAYHTNVGERGIILSGGERQRIAIARAILKDAPILILDEATSALDSESELYIQRALKSIMKNKTVIAIAHRLSTLKEMDKLIVLQKGKIIEQGTHKELLETKGVYANFYNLQIRNIKRKK